MAAAAASAVLLLALAGCTSTQPEATPIPDETTAVAVTDTACTDDTGVTVVVDASVLEDGDSKTWCIGTEETLAAADALTLLGVETEGTDEYPDDIVCRVNGVPAEDAALPADDGSDYFETCESMPAAFAYWSLWVQPAEGEWEYAQEGLATLELQPGESLELLFTLNGQPAAPTT